MYVRYSKAMIFNPPRLIGLIPPELCPTYVIKDIYNRKFAFVDMKAYLLGTIRNGTMTRKDSQISLRKD